MTDPELLATRLALVESCATGALGSPRTNPELFGLLEPDGWLSPTTLRNMVGFRNVLVHGYDTVDLAIVRAVVEHRLDDLLQFLAAIGGRLARLGDD